VNITVKLFATFRNGRFKIDHQEWPEGTDCRRIVASLGLTEEEIGIVLINGRHVSLEQLLAQGDSLSLFPLVGGG
jgi:molybdopterin converting factor small subunit